MEVEIRNKDGYRVPISVSTALLYDDDDEIIGAVETFRDMADIRKLSEALEHRFRFDRILGKSKPMQELYELLENVIETDDMTYKTIQNPHMSASVGAGIQAAQMMSNHDVETVISGILGPNAFQTLRAIGIPIYQATGGSVCAAVEAFKANQLKQINQPGPAHARMGGRGMGRAGGGMGRRNVKMGNRQGFQPSPMTFGQAAPPNSSKADEIDQLKQEATQLTSQLENISQKIKQLEQKSEK